MQFVDYYKPSNIREALELLNSFASNHSQRKCKLLAGGTDLIPRMKDDINYPDVIIEITDIAELKGIELQNQTLLIKAGTTFAEIAESELVRQGASLLACAARQIGSVQIRHRATIGGNVVNASPAGDSIPPLYVLQAQLHLLSFRNGTITERKIPVEKFFVGPGQTIIQGDELLTAISFPLPEPDSTGVFLKLGQRRAMAISKVNLALLAKAVNGRIEWVRLALGAVAPTVVRAYQTEAALTGKSIDDTTSIERAMEIVKSEVSPIDDIRSETWYRREMCGVLLNRAIRQFGAINSSTPNAG